MGLDRRNFLKTLGVAGATLAVGKSMAAGTDKKDHVEFYGMLYDSTRCVGCQTCETVCAEATDCQH